MPVFAGLYAAWNNTYDWVFSKIWIGESQRNDIKADPYRRVLWKKIKGNVLELGPGYAASLKFLHHKEGEKDKDNTATVDPSVIKSYTALEPNQYLFGGLKESAEKSGFRVVHDPETCKDYCYEDSDSGDVQFTIVKGSLDDSFDVPEAVERNAPYDSIVTSFTFCSVRDPSASLDNIYRLLKPGGVYYFIEHVRHSDDPNVIVGSDVNYKFWAFVQDCITPLWTIPGRGCKLNRRTGNLIRNMKGWEDVSIDTVRLSVDLKSRLLPMIVGTAKKAQE